MFNVVSVVLLVGLSLLAVSDFSMAFSVLRYFGIGVAAIFVFVCFNECFYLVRRLRQPVYKAVRQCDLASLACATVVTVIACLLENWILYDMMASCICVGCIKVFYF